MPWATISLRFTFVVLWIFYDNFINSNRAAIILQHARYKNTPRRNYNKVSYKCPDVCTCRSNKDEAKLVQGDLDLEVTCSTGGLTDKSLAKLLPNIPKISNVIRIEAPPWNPNNFALTQDLAKFTKLKRLTLKNCALPSLGKRTLDSVKNLKSLELPSNKIHFLSPDTFVNLDEVENLDLSQNLLNEDILPTGTFAHLTELISLNLSDNFIDKFASNLFSGLRKLKVLHLSGNFVNNSSDFDLLRDLPALEELHLARCHLNTIPDQAFQDNIHLKRLNLAKNSLNVRTLARFFYVCSNLESLDLSSNDLIGSPDGFFAKLPKLRSLNLAFSSPYNPSDRLAYKKFLRPQIFGDSSRIEHLNLSNNNIFEFDSEYLLRPLHRSIRSLDLSSNPLRTVLCGQTRFLTNLRYLYLSILTYLPDQAPKEYENLEFLDLSHNELSFISPVFLASLKSIEVIDFSFNHLETFPHFFADFARKLPGFISLHNNNWQCDCQTLGLLQDYLLTSSGDGQFDYVNVTCKWPMKVRNIPVVSAEKSVKCSTAYYRSQSIAFYDQPGFGVLLAGICGSLLLLSIACVMLYSYFSPQATYRTNEEKVILSTSTSSDSTSDRGSTSSRNEFIENTVPLC